MKAAFRLVLAAAVSILLLSLLFQFVDAGADQPELREIFQKIMPFLVLAYAACTLAQSVFRTIRYRLLLRAAGESPLPSFYHLFIVTLARNMMVDLFPSRLGELSYIALLNRGYNVCVPVCISSLALSFTFDLIALLVILGGLMVAAFSRWMPVVLLALLAVGAVGFAVMFRGFESARRWGRVGAAIDKVADAFSRTRRAGIMGRTMVLSLLVRAWKYAGFYCMFLAVTKTNFPALAAAPFSKVLVTLISAEAASSLPIPTFMSFGAYEAGGAAAWAALGASAGTATLALLALHIGSQIIDYSLGGLGLLLVTLQARGARSESAPSPRSRWIAVAAALACLAAAAGFAFTVHRSALKRGAATAPPPGRSVGAADIQSGQVPNGFVVWSSNRSGNHDIWMMTLPEGKTAQVTTNKNTETYPRISPDGQRIVFCRAHREWVSQRNEQDWDVILLDMQTKDETVVATNAYMPTWIDGHTVLIQKNGTSVLEHDLDTGQEFLLAASGRGEVPAGTNLQTPSYNPERRELAVTFRDGARMTALVRADGRVRKVAGGCEIFWSPDNERLFYVDHGGRMQNAFYLIDPETLEKTLWFDAEGDWSHEYFPKVSNDGHWLAYAAAAMGHEHDTADYEIFLWKIGAPFSSVARLTWHTGNDCWPDIYVRPDSR